MLAWGLPCQEHQQVQGLGQYISLAQQSGIRIHSRDDIVDEVLHRVGFHMDTLSRPKDGSRQLHVALLALAVIDKQIEEIMLHSIQHQFRVRIKRQFFHDVGFVRADGFAADT